MESKIPLSEDLPRLKMLRAQIGKHPMRFTSMVRNANDQLDNLIAYIELSSHGQADIDQTNYDE